MRSSRSRVPIYLVGGAVLSAAGLFYALLRLPAAFLTGPGAPAIMPAGTPPRVAALARVLDLPPAVVMAIQQVESRGSDSAVRFEPHLFLRTRSDLAGQIPYTPSGKPGSPSYVASETNRAALARAAVLDQDAAVRAASWGAYQVLGGRGIAEYGDAGTFTAAFWADPAGVSDRLLASWFRVNRAALTAARRADWAELARRYNGPGYAAGAYDAKLAAAHAAASAALA